MSFERELRQRLLDRKAELPAEYERAQREHEERVKALRDEALAVDEALKRLDANG